MQGDRPARLLHYNYLPIAMSAIPNPDFFFNNPFEENVLSGEDFYSEAEATTQEHVAEGAAGRTLWLGNFFPDMGVWDKLMHRPGRGSLNRSVYMRIPGSELRAHMSVFPAGTYKKGHRHGPGRVIVIPGGEGFSIMWQEGQEKIVIHWHRGKLASCRRTAGSTSTSTWAPFPDATWRSIRRTSSWACPSRCRTSRATRSSTRTRTLGFREYFESQLAERGIEARMPDEAYRDRNYRWDYTGVKEN